MRGWWGALVACLVLAPVPTRAEDMARLELNTVENANNRCSLTFVIENKTDRGIDSLKLDLALFNLESVIQRRMVTEMGPVRAKRTNVRTFATDGDCGQIGAVLVNDVTACAPLEPTACLDGLALSSRVKTIKLYK